MCYWLLCQQTTTTQYDILSRSDTLWAVVECWGGWGVEALTLVYVFLFFVYFPVLSLSGGDESQVALAIVLASSQDCGVYGCSISNEYGTDTTDFLLSVDSKIQYVLRHQMWNLTPITSPVLDQPVFSYSFIWNFTKRWFGRQVSPQCTTLDFLNSSKLFLRLNIFLFIQLERRSRWPHCCSRKALPTVAAGVTSTLAASWPKRCTSEGDLLTKPAEWGSFMVWIPSLSLEAPASSKFKTLLPMGPSRKATFQREMERLRSK